MEKNANSDENISIYAKRLLHVVSSTFFKKKERKKRRVLNNYSFFVKFRFKRNMKLSDPIIKNYAQQAHCRMPAHHPRLPLPQQQLLLLLLELKEKVYVYQQKLIGSNRCQVVFYQLQQQTKCRQAINQQDLIVIAAIVVIKMVVLRHLINDKTATVQCHTVRCILKSV